MAADVILAAAEIKTTVPIVATIVFMVLVSIKRREWKFDHTQPLLFREGTYCQQTIFLMSKINARPLGGNVKYLLRSCRRAYRRQCCGANHATPHGAKDGVPHM